MQAVHLRKYNQATNINFELFEVDGVDFRVDAVHASGDSVIMKDNGAEANTGSGFVDEGRGYSLALTAAEMSAARVVIYIVDQTATKIWLDKAIVIETYGNASAEHAFDLDTASTAQTADNDTKLTTLLARIIGTLATGTHNPATAAQIAVLSDWIDGGRLDLILDDILVDTGTTIPATLATLPTNAEVNLEMLDVMTIDTFAEPGSVPAATSTLKDKIGWPFTMTRNKMLQTATTSTLRNDADSGDIATSTVSDDTTTFTRGEWS